MGDSLGSDNVFEYGEVLLDAGVGAFLLHSGDVASLEVDDAAVVAGLVHLVEEFGCGVEIIGFLCGDGFHLLIY